MMLTKEGATLALETFCSQQLSETESIKLVGGMESYKDLLAYILLETDFLEQHPEIRQILADLSVSVSRSLLPSEEARHVRDYVIRRLYAELYEQQKQYASQSAALMQIEQNITNIKEKIERLRRPQGFLGHVGIAQASKKLARPL